MESHNHIHPVNPPDLSKNLVKDPVCGMMIDPKTAKGGSFVFKESTYFFCNPQCKTKFEGAPLKYLAPNSSDKNQSSTAEFTCPMHPEIRQIGPGNCPKCGMALEPLTVSLDQP
ncbi:MAG: heavy metal-binding domain-containing protein, partial [Bdellovibrionota bacterium]